MPDLSYERRLRGEGHARIAGIDEAGVGPLAGPVVAAAVVLPDDYEDPWLNDSKQLTEKRREILHLQITTDPRITWAFAIVEVDEIDRINILRATHRAMALAFEKLNPVADYALIDGRPVRNFPGRCESVVKGDAICLSIAAASIIAKVERDRMMCAFSENFPGYGFERHKGYGTAAHLSALRALGPCPLHRRSFAPVSQLELPLT